MASLRDEPFSSVPLGEKLILYILKTQNDDACRASAITHHENVYTIL